jgi:hypothetical protein
MPAHAERDLAVVGATIYPAPGASVISNGIVIIRDGVIAAIEVCVTAIETLMG